MGDARDQVQMRMGDYVVVMEGNTGSRVARRAAAVAYSLWGEKAGLSQGTHLREVWSVDQVTRLCEAAWECQ